MIKGLFVSLAILLAGCASPVGKKAEKEGVSFLYVITSAHGEIRKAGSGFELVLDQSHVEKVVAFSNRPERIVKDITDEEFKNVWVSGSPSFSKDPPNAAVVIGEHVQTVVIIDYRLEGSKMIFKIRSDGPSSLHATQGKTSVFIDGFCTDANPIQGLDPNCYH